MYIALQDPGVGLRAGREGGFVGSFPGKNTREIKKRLLSSRQHFVLIEQKEKRALSFVDYFLFLAHRVILL